jgi:hypothetical protein
LAEVLQNERGVHMIVDQQTRPGRGHRHREPEQYGDPGDFPKVQPYEAPT